MLYTPVKEIHQIAANLFSIMKLISTTYAILDIYNSGYFIKKIGLWNNIDVYCFGKIVKFSMGSLKL